MQRIDEAQGIALKSGDMSSFHDDVDFAKLAARTNDDMNTLPQGVPPAKPLTEPAFRACSNSAGTSRPLGFFTPPLTSLTATMRPPSS